MQCFFFNQDNLLLPAAHDTKGNCIFHFLSSKYPGLSSLRGGTLNRPQSTSEGKLYLHELMQDTMICQICVVCYNA